MKNKYRKPTNSFSTNTGRSSNSGASNIKKSSRTSYQERKEPTFKYEKDTPKIDDAEYNSGFGTYLRSPEGTEMMKLFVLANTVVLIVTMAWPNIKEIYNGIEEWYFNMGHIFQGALLMGVVYMYTRGMLGIVNEYYREEFKKHLENSVIPKVKNEGKQFVIKNELNEPKVTSDPPLHKYYIKDSSYFDGCSPQTFFDVVTCLNVHNSIYSESRKFCYINGKDISKVNRKSIPTSIQLKNEKHKNQIQYRNFLRKGNNVDKNECKKNS